MANPLPHEKELYKKITEEKLSIPRPIWELIDHHLGNDLYAISLIVGSHVIGNEKDPVPVEDGEKIMRHIEGTRLFLKKLSEVTK